MVPQTKLKLYTTTKQDAPKFIYRRPPIEYLIPDNEDPIIPTLIEEKKEPKAEEKKVEEAKQFESMTVSDERKQTMKPSPQPEIEARPTIAEEKSEPVKPQPQMLARNGSLDSKTFQILSNDIDVIQTKPQ